jgi:hypothetical protein
MQLKKTAAIRATRFGKTTLGSRPKVFDEALPEKGFPGTQKQQSGGGQDEKKGGSHGLPPRKQRSLAPEI